MRAESIALLLLLVACYPAGSAPGALAAEDAAPTLRASLERTTCFGTCPVYRVDIFSDGKVRYHGQMFVKQQGEREGQLSAAQLAELDAAFATAGFMSMDGNYGNLGLTDAPTVNVTYAKDGVTKVISDYRAGDGTPVAVTRLEEDVDRIVGTARWVGR